jgi:flagellar biosynthesis/type III secretory pathway protein FliH
MQPEATLSQQRDTPASVECEQAIAAARRFRAGLSDALESAVPELLGSIARDVLARELMLGPVDLAAIVAAAIDGCAQTVLSIHVHPADLEVARRFESTVSADRGLKRGDLRLELHSGTIDLTLAARLDAVLATYGT